MADNNLTDSSDAPDADFARRVISYLDNTLNAADFKQLQVELAASAPRRRQFIELAMVRRGTIELLRTRAVSAKNLRLDVAQASYDRLDLGETMVMPAVTGGDVTTDEPAEQWTPTPVSQQKTQQPWWLQPRIRIAAAVLLSCGAVAAWRATQLKSPAQTPETPIVAPEVIARADVPTIPVPVIPVAPPIAVLDASINASWDHGSFQPVRGSAITAGMHTLDAGAAELNLSGGASVVLQAPAQFAVVSPTLIQMNAGQVSAKVPHGSAGLTINTPDMHAVDLGTEFGLDVLPRGQTHMEVFTGQVRAESTADSNAGSQIVDANHAVRITRDSKKIVADAPAPLSFIRAGELEQLASTSSGGGQKRWQAFSDFLRHDPSLLAYYDFQTGQNDSATLSNTAVTTAGTHDGAFGLPNRPDLFPQWSQGRWPGKSALQFGLGQGTFVMLRGDGAFVPSTNMSVVFWIQRAETTLPVHLINREFMGGGSFNISLIGSGGKNINGRTKQKQLLPNSIYFNFGPGEICFADALPPTGQWTLLAITVDQNRFTRFYVDGKLVGEMPMKMDHDAEPTGDICIGRSAPGNASADSQDIFRGKMDELAIFQRVLAEREIHRMFEAGQP